MADTSPETDVKNNGDNNKQKIPSAEKRKFTEEKNSAEPSEKRIAISLNIGKKPISDLKPAPIKMSLTSQKQKEATPVVKPKTATIAQVFNEDEESEEEEMPAEAKMRMRNIGRDTPTAAGPNSYGKDKLGFCDRQKMIEKQFKNTIEEG